MKKLAIIGSRSLEDEVEPLVLDWIQKNLNLAEISTFVSGGASGADTFAERLAKQLNKEMIVFLPEYKKYSRKATMIRNEEIAKTADFCLALVDKPLKTSTGTNETVNKFKRLKKPVTVIRFKARDWYLDEVKELL